MNVVNACFTPCARCRLSRVYHSTCEDSCKKRVQCTPGIEICHAFSWTVYDVRRVDGAVLDGVDEISTTFVYGMVMRFEFFGGFLDMKMFHCES